MPKEKIDKELPSNLSPIATPLAGKKLAKKIFKTIKKGGLFMANSSIQRQEIG
jgi:hypothetical protein